MRFSYSKAMAALTRGGLTFDANQGRKFRDHLGQARLSGGVHGLPPASNGIALNPSAGRASAGTEGFATSISCGLPGRAKSFDTTALCTGRRSLTLIFFVSASTAIKSLQKRMRCKNY
jgi:hypothetical protein